MKASTEYVGFSRIGDMVSVVTDGPELRICFLTPELVRVRASFDRLFEEESYILTMTAWEDRFDDMFEGERERVQAVIPEIEENGEAVLLRTSAVTLRIQKKPFGLSLSDADGNLLYQDVYGYAFVQERDGHVFHYTQVNREDAFYGFGEKSGRLNKQKTYMKMGGTDAMAWDPIYTDPLYKHIPFYIRLQRDNHKAVGLFYNNTYDSAFKICKEVGSLCRTCASFEAWGGDIDLFLIAGGKISHILDLYTRLTGRPVMLPKRALGYQGSGMAYSEQPTECDRHIRGFVETARAENYPLDGFYLSSGYTAQGENKRCVFTWNKDRYADPEGFVRYMNEEHVPLLPNVKPGVLLTHPLYEEMRDQDVFIRDASGEKEEIGVWWGGPGTFWDFTKPKAREVWKAYLKSSLLDLGITGIWNDNCEYEGVPDKDAVCDFDGKKAPIGSLRPVLPTLMNRMSMEAMQEKDPDLRPYILSRGGFAGIQRYAQTWGGDTVTSWDTLRYNIATILGMSLSGVPNYGMDICGFTGIAPDAELLVRWIQSGIFQPRFCIHSANIDFTVTEPWMYPAVKDLVHDAVMLRYALTPYLYSAEYAAHETGEPIMRPLVYDFQEDVLCCDEDINYLFGESLLVANVVEQGAESKSVYLPKGVKWYDFYTFRPYEGGQTLTLPVTLSSLPLFIREGSFLPIAANPLMCLDTDVVTDLRMIISPKGITSYTLYDDDGRTNDYKKGIFHKTRFEVHQGSKTLIQVTKEGSYEDTIKRVQLELISPEGAPVWIALNGSLLRQHMAAHTYEQETCGWFFDPERRAVLIRFDNPEGDYQLVISREVSNLLGM